MIFNEGTADRLVRLVVAAAAALFSWWAGFGSVGGIILLVFAGWMVVTATVGYCPAYQLLAISRRAHRPTGSQPREYLPSAQPRRGRGRPYPGQAAGRGEIDVQEFERLRGELQRTGSPATDAAESSARKGTP